MLWGRLIFGYMSFQGMVIEFQVATLDLRMGPKQSEYGAADLANQNSFGHGQFGWRAIVGYLVLDGTSHLSFFV